MENSDELIHCQKAKINYHLIIEIGIRIINIGLNF